MRDLILASLSPRRQELLRFITEDFKVVPAHVDEDISEKMPDKLTMELSAIKAEAVFKDNPSHIVIGSDTVVYKDGRILGKPAHKDEAFRMLKELSGSVHEVYTGVTVRSSEKTVTFFEKTEVAFIDMSDEEILSYIGTGEPMDKAGAYGIQGLGARFVRYVSGDFFTVMGLPVSRLYITLKKEFPEIFQ